jgi:hypothetical protein
MQIDSLNKVSLGAKLAQRYVTPVELNSFDRDLTNISFFFYLNPQQGELRKKLGLRVTSLGGSIKNKISEADFSIVPVDVFFENNKSLILKEPSLSHHSSINLPKMVH